ncbi:hypothetical protein V6N12_035922 [Hibiscus sabdariffa]|uniref:Protein kinase domain-containing protein n=1 Tax=Hibiscus sabdariffa TaxID=183260 RepID=A0ABR2EP41_9ROSI
MTVTYLNPSSSVTPKSYLRDFYAFMQKVRRANENHAVEGGLKELKFPGTPLYMPLETIVKHHICLALDTWSLGCVVLQMITGKLPCDGMKDKMELAIKILFSRNPPNQIRKTLSDQDLLKPALARLSAKQSLPLGTKSCAYSRSDSIQKELYILRQFQDSNKIVKCFDDVVSLEKGVTVYNVFLEYASGGTLRDLIRRYDGNIPEPFVKCYTKILFEGLRCIHAEGYLHCDLKLENIFVFLGRGSDVTLKIVDFGLVRRDNENHAVEGGLKELKFPGTPLYMPLETIVKHHICLALDTWSLGCVVLQMITGKLPCDGMKDKMELAIKILFSRNPPNQIRKTLSDQGKDFLMKCFAREPGERTGVTCNVTEQRVTSIDLENLGL